MKNIWQAISVFYTPRYPKIIVYMLQRSEYRVNPYLMWFWRTQNFARVMRRGELVRTKAARLLGLALSAGIIIEMAVGLWLIYRWHWHNFAGGWEFGLALIIAAPVIWAQLITVPIFLGRLLIVQPNEQRLINASEKIFKNHPGIRLAIAGSYGKTSMKELLQTVLGEAKKVAATPGNKNVSISHARFAKSLAGDEDILLIEYGEGAPGDVTRFAKATHPTHGIITGLAPAHLDRYKTLHAAGTDIFSLATYLKNQNVYVSGDSPAAKDFIKKDFKMYDQTGVPSWKVHDAEISIHGTKFTLKKSDRELKLHSGLLGRHQLGPLSLAAALAHEFGLNQEEIIAGIARTKPFEHRMQPYQLSGAWVIDDTYNGNIEGIRAGTELLKDLPAKRKIYVTPGLVDQGKETERIHAEMGELIAAAHPDLVVLMRNSTTHFIKKGLDTAGFTGQLQIEHHPLQFYQNLAEFTAAGDLLMLQNDWPDNYA